MSGRAALAVLLALAAAPASADPADEIMATFQAYCLAHIGQPSETIAALDEAGAFELRTAAAEPFLTGISGHVWTLPGRIRSVVILTDKGVCGVRSPDVDGAAVVALIAEKTKSRLISTRERPHETESRYAVTVGDRHAVVIANVGRLDSGAGIVLDALSEGLLPIGAAVPRWP